VTLQSHRESVLSRRVRRLCGFVALGALGVAMVSVVGGLGGVAIGAFLVGWILPYAVMVVHLGVTRSLTDEEKRMWRSQLVWSHRSRSLIAAWAYVLAEDLAKRARGFAPYRGGIDAG
jgi:hypothetical protein